MDDLKSAATAGAGSSRGRDGRRTDMERGKLVTVRGE
jgi:hypothetical protein